MKKLLIANRGEIAVRIMRTASRMGITTGAVYSDLDLLSPHTKFADWSFRLGGERADESYLRIDKLLEAASAFGADAIHPGYGFLSEQADFARAVTEAGLIFVGPSAQAMELLGRKDSARSLAADLGIPTPPGYQADAQDIDSLSRAAKNLGFPLMIKAAAGGGGRGMRRVDSAEELESSLSSAKREAERFFGDGRLFLEKLITSARHIEIQVIGDIHGGLIHLFERDCSIQRRYQKVIEEAPAVGLSSELLEKLYGYALALAKAGQLHNAATFEFLVETSGNTAFFLEANTRLQVEHPVTEEITGVDLVELQLLVASGKALPLTQADIVRRGHAVEARVYAEVPQGDTFHPAGGCIRRWSPPPGIRTDHALAPGLFISTEYDPLLAKVIAHGENAAEAREKLSLALSNFELSGVGTNAGFLTAVLQQMASEQAPPTTDFLARRQSEISSANKPEDYLEAVCLAYAGSTLLQRMDRRRRGAFFILPAHSLLYELLLSAPTLATPVRKTMALMEVALAENVVNGRADFGDGPRQFSVRRADLRASLEIICGGASLELAVIGDTPSDGAYRRLTVLLRGHVFDVSPPSASSVTPEAGSAPEDNHLRAPLPGTIIRVSAAEGAAVKAGETLAVIESMKMEHRITAPRSGIIEKVTCSPGQTVKGGDVVMILAEDGSPEGPAAKPVNGKSRK